MSAFTDAFNAISYGGEKGNLQPSAASPMDFGGLLFGGMDGGLNEYLTDAQRQAMQRQAMMSAAAALLKSSGRSTTPVSIGQALGQGLEAGAAGYQQAQQGALAQLMAKQKLDEAKREQALQKYIMSRIPGMATGAAPTTSLLSPDQPITGVQAASLPVSQFGLGPTTQRDALIGKTMPQDMAVQELPGVTTTAKGRPDIFSTLTPDQLLLAAQSPKTFLPKIFEESLKTESFATLSPSEAESLGLDPAGKYQQNLRTGQVSTLQAAKEEFKVVTGLEAEAFGLPGSSKWQVNTTSKQATLVPASPGAFGGGVQGNAYDIILDGVNSGKTNTVQYALAFRALSMPVPTEQVRADGSLETVYKQPMPLPASIPRPTFSGKIPEVTKPVTVVPSAAQAAPTAAPVTARAPAPSAAPVVSPTTGATAVPLPAGVKSTPMAPRPEEISATRKAVNAGVDFVAALNKMENMVRTQGMQLGGMGEQGAAQEVVYEDLLTKIRIAAELGVLNKEDLPRIQAQLGSPTALSTYIKGLGGPSAFYSQIGQLRNKAIEETTRKNLQFGQPVMNLPDTFSIAAPAPMPTTITPPPVINDILLKYPAPRKP
jgi:hypothetical protein